MASTASLLGNYAPAMQEPYQIETALAKEATGGNRGLASMMQDQYWFERQMREGSYAQRLADQMAFGQQQLNAQREEAVLKTLPGLAKENLLGATLPYLQGRFGYGLSIPDLADAANLARSTTQSGILANAGKGFLSMVQGGATPETSAMSNLTGLPLTDTGPLALRVQAAKAKSGGEPGGKDSFELTLSPTGKVEQINPKFRGAGGLQRMQQYLRDSTLPPAGGGTNSQGESVKPIPTVPSNQTRKTSQLDPVGTRKLAAIINSTKGNNPVAHADIMAGGANGTPNIQYDDQGNLFAIGASGQQHPVGNMAQLYGGVSDDDETDTG